MGDGAAASMVGAGPVGSDRVRWRQRIATSRTGDGWRAVPVWPSARLPNSGGRSGRVDTERGHGTSWPSMFTDRFGEARTFARTTGRRTVRRAFSVARARLQGSEAAMRWPRASLKAAYDVVV